jgi:hypothetical protein
MEKFKVNDRVRRLPYSITLAKQGGDAIGFADGDVETMTVSTRGCCGVVKSLRHETSAASAENKNRSLMVQVLWDNGTLSYHGPEALEHTK